MEEVDRKQKEFEMELRAVLEGMDQPFKRLWPIFIIPLVLILFYTTLFTMGGGFGALLVFYLIGVVTCLIIEFYSVTRRFLKGKGLMCPNCGFLPRIKSAPEVYRLKVCPECKTELSIT